MLKLKKIARKNSILSKPPQKSYEKIKEFTFLQHVADKSSRRSLQMRVKGMVQMFGKRVFIDFFNFYNNFLVFENKNTYKMSLLTHNNEIMCKIHHALCFYCQKSC